MRKHIHKWAYLLLIVAITFLTACNKEDEEETGKKDGSFDVSLLYGKWHNGTEYYRFDSNGQGQTWDTGDDISEDEGSWFTWELSGSSFKIIHEGQMGQKIPKYYTLTTLTSTSLKFKDDFDTYSYSK